MKYAVNESDINGPVIPKLVGAFKKSAVYDTDQLREERLTQKYENFD
jgi:hypothetical protein